MNDVYCDLVFLLFFVESICFIVIIFKIYMMMKEVKYICCMLVMLELEVLDLEERFFKELINGRLCFCC